MAHCFTGFCQWSHGSVLSELVRNQNTMAESKWEGRSDPFWWPGSETDWKRPGTGYTLQSTTPRTYFLYPGSKSYPSSLFSSMD
jgi:hypothetical protein